jgi:multidrug efflux pump
MGLVIFTGLSIGTLFTLFVVPAVYLILGETHKAEHEESDDDDLESLPPPEPLAR